MNKTAAGLLVLLLLQGCLVVAEKRTTGPRPAPAPAPAPEPAPVEVQPDPAGSTRSLTMTYKTDIPKVYQAATKVVDQRRYVVTASNDHGDYRWLIAEHQHKEVRMDLNRRNHKTHVTIRLAVDWGTDYDALRMAKDLHNAIGQIIGEQGND